MSAEVERWLRELASSIEPGPARIAAASRSQNYLRELLLQDPRILGSYLSGSYSRRTAIWPLDDVDIVFLLDPAGWRASFWTEMPKPSAVLSSLQRAVKKRYKASKVRLQRRSVRLCLYHLDIDLVPAIQSGPDSDLVMIPDRNADEWLTSSPLRHSQIATQLNQATGGLFIPLVKILKLWNANLPSTAQVKSFCVETIAVHLFSNTGVDSLQDGVIKFHDFVAWLGSEPHRLGWSNQFGVSWGILGAKVPDAAGTGSNTAGGVDAKRRKRFAASARVSCDRLAAAGAARTHRSLETNLNRAFRVPTARRASG